MSTTEQDLTGRMVGQYKLVKTLGYPGAQGCTYRSEHEVGTRKELFAIKVLHPDAKEKDLARFKREAELLGSLDHPNIERIVDHNYDPNYRVYYIVKNFVKAISLESVLEARKKRKKSVTPKETLELAGQIAWALAHAHARQDIPDAPAERILHLDLKPSNILVGCRKNQSLEGKKAWLIDFGLGVWGIREGERPHWAYGTTPYTSPEHIRGGPFTRQTDLYQFGILLYEMLTGKRPFEHRDPKQAERKIMENPAPPPRSFNPKLPESVDSFFEKALAKDQEQRFSTVEQMFEAFLASCPGGDPHALQEILNGPHLPPPELVTSTDGVKIAFTRKGAGVPLIYPPPWVTHQGIQWASPRLRSLFERLAEKCEIVSYDRRGCGLSDRQGGNLLWEAQLRDLELVIDHCRLDRLTILGISAAGPLAISYAAAHTEKVSKLILYGTFAKLRDHADVAWSKSFINYTRENWGLAAGMLNEIFIPGASEEERRWLTFYQRASSEADQAALFASQLHELDVKELAKQVKCSTLVIHRFSDKPIPFRCGEQLASLIPGARLIRLEGNMHPPWSGDSQPVVEAILDFLTE